MVACLANAPQWFAFSDTFTAATCMYACQKNFDWHAIIGSYWRSASEIHGIDDTMYNEKVLSYVKKK